MQKILMASNNENKVREVEKLLDGLDCEVVNLTAFPDLELPPEDGVTFVENAVIKAMAGAKATGLITVADDSGLEVDYLNGEPGVYSARFAGPQHDDADNNKKLVQMMKTSPEMERGARFVSAIVIATPEGKTYESLGHCEGQIILEPRGNGGFGYDPYFYIPKLGKTMAELSMVEKNKISHRATALTGIMPVLRKLIKG